MSDRKYQYTFTLSSNNQERSHGPKQNIPIQPQGKNDKPLTSYSLSLPHDLIRRRRFPGRPLTNLSVIAERTPLTTFVHLFRWKQIPPESIIILERESSKNIKQNWLSVARKLGIQSPESEKVWAPDQPFVQQMMKHLCHWNLKPTNLNRCERSVIKILIVLPLLIFDDHCVDSKNAPC